MMNFFSITKSRPCYMLLMLIFTASLLVACAPEADPDDPVDEAVDTHGGTVNVPIISDTSPWPVTIPGAVASIMVNKTVFNGLVRYSAEDGVTVVPDLAESWSWSDDGLELTFNLREDVRWHDGEPFTAEDVKFSLDLYADRDGEVGARWSTNLVTVDSVEVVDEHTVTLHFSDTNASFLTLAAYNLMMLPKHKLAHLEPEELVSPSDFIRNPIGTGPFVWEEHISDGHIIVKANEDYHEGRPNIDRIVYKIMPDVNTQLAQLRTGEIDIVYEIEAHMYEEAKAIPNVKITTPEPPPSIISSHSTTRTPCLPIRKLGRL